MANNPEPQGESPRRPRLVLPGAAEGPVRPKIVLPGLGVILDPNVQPPPTDSPAEEATDASVEATVELGGEVLAEQPMESAGEIAEEALPMAADAAELTADDFLTETVAEAVEEEEAGRPPELRAAPAELKELAPRRLGPPPGWQPGEDVPPLEAAPVPSQVVWDDPMPALEEEAVPSAESGAEAIAGGVPLVAPLRPQSSRVPTPLTSPHSDRPATRRVTQQVRPETGHTTRHHATAGAAHPGPGALPAKPMLLPAPQRLVPAWILVLIGLLVGAIGSLIAVVKSPLRDKIGLVSRADANAYVLAVLKEERAQVQSMLNDFHQNARVDLASDMSEFRTEQGRKAPEKMTMDEFAAEIKEEAELKKQEEEEDRKIAEEEAKAKEEEEKKAAEEPAKE